MDAAGSWRQVGPGKRGSGAAAFLRQCHSGLSPRGKCKAGQQGAILLYMTTGDCCHGAMGTDPFRQAGSWHERWSINRRGAGAIRDNRCVSGTAECDTVCHTVSRFVPVVGAKMYPERELFVFLFFKMQIMSDLKFFVKVLIGLAQTLQNDCP